MPDDFKYWLAFSVPTQYGGTLIEPEWFAGFTVHLLGGSPRKQAEYAQLMKVVSLDGNYAMKLAKYGKSSWQGTFSKKLETGCYESFRLSLAKQKAYWHREWRWEDEPLAQLADERGVAIANALSK